MNNHVLNKDGIRAGNLALELVWKDGIPDGNLSEIKLRWSADLPDVEPVSDLARELAPALEAYARGEDAQWPDAALDFDALPPFRARILRTLAHEVGHGRTVTYGQLSAMAGHPNAPRAVGQAMAHNPWPLLVPCHRVLGAGGKMTGFSGAGVEMKKYLLELEKAL